MRPSSTSTRLRAPAVIWWTRDFPGDPDQVRAARRWIADLLPDCGPLADVLLVVSELCTNAVMHTRSGEPGGRFSVVVEWTGESARVVIEDQGSPKAPAIDMRTGDATGAHESGRGLRLVDELADDWGTASRPGRRWVWADVQWRAGGGPPLGAPGDIDAMFPGVAAIREAFPGTTIWWGRLTKAWWASVPQAAGSGGLIGSPSRDGLRRALAGACPRFRHSTPTDGPTGVPVLCSNERSRQS
jgi:anti-sigma regulatory factor (Ser/Thr protein kinase)